MKKIYLTFALLSLLFSSKASHLIGAEVYWDCAGNGDYIFNLVLYRDCTGIPLPTSNQSLSTDAIPGNIICNFISSTDISLACYDPSQQLSCSGGSTGSVEKYVYQSAPITISGTPPATGYTFAFSDCCRPGSLNNTATSGYYVEAVMYANSASGCQYGSPRFSAEPNFNLELGKGSISAMAFTPEGGDSIVHSLVSPYQSSSTPILWSSGYSTNAPFPDASEDASNGPVTIDPNSGLIAYEVNGYGGSSSSGSFAYAIEADSWRNGTLYSSAKRDHMIYGSMFAVSANTPPSFSATAISSLHTVVNVGYGVRKVECSIGDTVIVDVNTQDFDFNPGGLPQAITISAVGRDLDPVFGGSGMPNKATWEAVSPQIGTTQALTNDVRLTYIIPNTFSAGDRSVFNFNVLDDACPFPGTANLSLVLKIRDPLSIQQDTVVVCDGDTVQVTGWSDSGNYLWSPNTNISNNTVASPHFYPSSSQYYYLTDPTNPGLIDSVYISVEPAAQLSLSFQNGVLIPSSSLTLDAYQWYYAGIPFTAPNDTVYPFASGVYYFEGTVGSCTSTSNSVTVVAGSFKTFVDPNNGNHSLSAGQLSGSLGADFQITNVSNTTLNSINIAGVFAGKPKKMASGTLTAKLYEKATQVELFSLDTLVTTRGEILDLPTNIQLSLNTEYTLAVTADSNLYLYAYEGVSFPYTPNNNGLTVTDASSGIALQYPSSATNRVLPVSLSFAQDIGLDENSESLFSIYPNPAKNEIFIQGLEEGTDYTFEAKDISGKRVALNIVKSGNQALVSVQEWPNGMYFITIKSSEHQEVFKLLKK